MNKLKNIAITLIGIVLLGVLVGYLLPRKVHVEKSIKIKAKSDIIFNQINNLENWKNWAPWFKLDTTMKISYEGKSGKGSGYSWTSLKKNVGSGRITMTESKPNEFLSFEMDFKAGGKSSSYFRFETIGDSVKVYWGFDNDLGINPFMRYFGGFIAKMIAKSYEDGLNTLKKFSEKLAKEGAGLNIYMAQSPTGKYLSLKAHSSLINLSIKLGEIFKSIMDNIQKNKVRITGSPIVIYDTFSEEAIDFEAGIPFTGDLKPQGRFKVISLPAGNVVIADYYGSYQNMAPAYTAIQEWINTCGKQIKGSTWEEYITDPTMEKDTTHWFTKIYYPVK